MHPVQLRAALPQHLPSWQLSNRVNIEAPLSRPKRSLADLSFDLSSDVLALQVQALCQFPQLQVESYNTEALEQLLLTLQAAASKLAIGCCV